MPRRAAAYLADIVDASVAISKAIEDLDPEAYAANRLVRSAVEREFIIIGEAASALSRHAPAVFSEITNARRIVDFRNLLTHEYATVDDSLVWSVAKRDVPILHEECASLLVQRPGNDRDAGLL